MPGATGITGTHLHRSDLFYVDLAIAMTLNIPFSLATELPTRSSALITNGTVIDDFTLS